MIPDPGHPAFHMWFVLILTGLAVFAFAREKYPLEVTSVALLTILLLFGQFFPVPDANGQNQLNATALLAGFANPSLIAVLALLVMGQAIIQTDALRPVTQMFVTANKGLAWVSMIAILIFVAAASAFMNNTPLVVIAIPIMQALAHAAGLSESRIMMPLSFAAIMGGMTTLVGSSTNLLVSSTMTALGYAPFGFFSFTVPGLMLAAAGLFYAVFLLPSLLPNRRSFAQRLVGDEKEFVAEIDVAEDSKLIGMQCENGTFPKLPALNIRLIQRGGHLILPPFEGYTIESGDILIVAATREALADILAQYPGFLLSEEQEEAIAPKKDPDDEESTGPIELEEGSAETRTLAEIMINPGSRLIEMALEHAGFQATYGVTVLGIQRRARVVRRRLGRIRLEAGDVLLVAGTGTAIDDMRTSRDLIVLSGSKKDLPVPAKAPLAGGIALSVIALAALGVLSIPVAAIAGAVLLIATGCINVRQATRAIDRKIFLLVGSMLALGTAMQATGGARFIAVQMLDLPFAEIPLAVAAMLFLLVALCTNVLTNNACAILFTPIALNLAIDLGVDPYIFAMTVIFGANCSFASPIGYQTNLLVMGPGHYRFRDFIHAGVPLVLVLWGAYILVAKFYFGL